ncbi:hypothetical protein NEOC65_001981 [Neochlamydia sp. AcF65]|nr:hypothetical protein [Neochlamydia sp. AcF65]
MRPGSLKLCGYPQRSLAKRVIHRFKRSLKEIFALVTLA